MSSSGCLHFENSKGTVLISLLRAERELTAAYDTIKSRSRVFACSSQNPRPQKCSCGSSGLCNVLIGGCETSKQLFFRLGKSEAKRSRALRDNSLKHSSQISRQRSSLYRICDSDFRWRTPNLEYLFKILTHLTYWHYMTLLFAALCTLLLKTMRWKF